MNKIEITEEQFDSTVCKILDNFRETAQKNRIGVPIADLIGNTSALHFAVLRTLLFTSCKTEGKALDELLKSLGGRQ